VLVVFKKILKNNNKIIVKGHLPVTVLLIKILNSLQIRKILKKWKTIFLKVRMTLKNINKIKNKYKNIKNK